MWPFKNRAVMKFQPIVDEVELNEQTLAALCPEIRFVSDAEIEAGNEIDGVTFSHSPKDNCCIRCHEAYIRGQTGMHPAKSIV